MKKQKSENKSKKVMKYITPCLVSLIVIGSVVGSVYYMDYMPFDYEGDKDIPTVTTGDIVSGNDQIPESYITETCYDGSHVLPEYVFQYPFQKSKYYVSNKKCVDMLKEEKLQDIQDRTIGFANAFFQNSRDISEDYETYEKTLSSYFAKDATYITEKRTLEPSKAYLSNLAKAVYDSGIQAVLTYDTDKSLVWQDMAYMVRGIVTLDVISIRNPEVLAEYIDISLEDGVKYEILWDISLINGEETRQSSESVISGIEILKVKGE